MGVYIKGMEMPKNCASCKIEQEVAYADETGFPYIGAHRCPLVYPSYTDESRYKGLLPNCPLVPVPPHGRLINVDAIHADIDEKRPGRSYEDAWALTVINAAPTIIPADPGGASPSPTEEVDT